MPLRLIGGKLVNDDGEAVNGADDVTPVPDRDTSRDLVCVECGTPLTYGGRGPYPKYCDEHRPVSPNRSSRSTPGTAPRRNTTLRNENALREALTARYFMLSNIAGLRHPAYRDQIRNKTEQAVEADIAYAKVNPTFRKWLESGLEKTAAAEVVAVHVSMFAPVVVGEAATRGRKKAPGNRGEAARPATPNASRATNPPPPQQPSNPSPEPSAENVTRLRRVPEARFPAEHVTEGDASETTNYDGIPDVDGMPGV